MRSLLSIVLFTFFLAPAFAQENQPAGNAERGHQAFMKYQCYTCHGTVGQGADRGTGPRIAPKPLAYRAFLLQVRTPRQDMPAYRKAFVTDEELADIYAYLLSIKPSPDPKDIPLLQVADQNPQ
jgi:mono/diheme cytochrome c family protein